MELSKLGALLNDLSKRNEERYCKDTMIVGWCLTFC